MLQKGRGLVFPKSKNIDKETKGKCLHTYKYGNEQNLHSVSMAPDCENFLTADSNRISLWNMEKSKSTVFSLIDYNRKHASENDERITSAKFNSSQSQSCVFLYTTSFGKINVCDFREKSNFSSTPSCSFNVNWKAN